MSPGSLRKKFKGLFRRQRSDSKSLAEGSVVSSYQEESDAERPGSARSSRSVAAGQPSHSLVVDRLHVPRSSRSRAASEPRPSDSSTMNEQRISVPQLSLDLVPVALSTASNPPIDDNIINININTDADVDMDLNTSTDKISPEYLWDEAYDQLKAENAKLIELYETILSNKLQNYNFDPSQQQLDGNSIVSSKQRRREQLLRLIESGRDKIGRESSIKDAMGQAMDVVVSLKQVISSTVQVLPQAALPWSIVCMGLEIIQNPLKQQKANDEGIRYVTKRMNWYWSLASDVLKESGSVDNDELPSTQSVLRTRLVELYKELLLFQIKSVCSYYRNRGLVLLRDVVKFDDWAGSVDAIRKLETEFRQDHGDHMSRQNVDMNEQMIRLLEKLVDLQVTNLKGDMQCLRDLHITDPRKDKKRIEETKGGLLQDSYDWVTHTEEYKEWLNNDSARLLWIKGDPGKGKTMLLCGIINELERLVPFPNVLAYSFCQGTDQKLNNAIAVMRGIIYTLVCQQPSLISHLEKEYQGVRDRSLFEDVNAWITLSGILTNMLQDPAVENSCLVIDALDECEIDRKKLLEFIMRSISDAPRVKWIVSSRNYVDIESKFDPSPNIVKLYLEHDSHAATITKSVGRYIRKRVAGLNFIQDDKELQDRVCDQMLQKSNGTFLWVALVFEELTDAENCSYEDDAEVLELLNKIPSGLPALYGRMMDQIGKLANKDPSRCRTILSVIALAYRPIRLSELPILAHLSGKLGTQTESEKLIQKCGSFLTIRENIIYFIHQSAKDFLVQQEPHHLFPEGSGIVHRDLFRRSMEALSTHDILRHNMYSLPFPGVEIQEISVPDPDPLGQVQYVCVYWLRHFCDHNKEAQGRDSSDIDKVYTFLVKSFLHWLEALSLLRHLQTGIVSFQALLGLVDETLQDDQHSDFFRDAMKFIFHNRYIIEIAPLQIYISALIFSPSQSIVRRLFVEEVPWIQRFPQVDSNWALPLHTLQSHALNVRAITFSSDSKLLASVDDDGTIRIWDAVTGAAVHTLHSSSYSTNWLRFLKDSKFLVSRNEEGAVTGWDIESGAKISEDELRHILIYASPSFGPNLLSIVEDPSGGFFTRNLVTGEAVKQCIPPRQSKFSVMTDCFDLLARTDYSNWIAIEILDMATGNVLRKIEPNSRVDSMVFSKNSKLLASAFENGIVQIWNVATGEEIQIITSGRTMISSLIFSDNCEILVTGGANGSVNVWDLAQGGDVQTHVGHTNKISCLALSGDSRLLATASWDQTIRIWSTLNGQVRGCQDSDTRLATNLAFSADAKLMAVASFGEVEIWDRNTEQKKIFTELMPFAIEDATFIPVMTAFSSNFRFLADLCSNLTTSVIRVWSIDKTEILYSLIEPGIHVSSLTFSSDSKHLALLSQHFEKPVTNHIHIWDSDTGKKIQVLKFDDFMIHRIFFNDNYLHFVGKSSCLRLVRSEVDGLYSTPEAKYLVPAQIGDLGYSTTFDNTWISWNGNKMIWLPSDFRPINRHSIAFSDSEIAIGTYQNYIQFFEFDKPPSQQSSDWTPWQLSRLFRK